MTTTNRTDIHRPTEMDPQNYEFVGAFDNASVPGWVLAGGDWALEISRKIARDDRLDRSVFQCHHCGARIRYFAVLSYTPTGEYIVVGETCLDNRFSLVSKAEFDRLRKAAALDRQAQRIKTTAAEFVANLSGVAAVALDRETDLEATYGLSGYGLSTVTDIRRKLWNVYGEISERQVAFVERLIAEVPARAAAAAERAAEDALKIPAPVGRVTVEGVVVSRKWKDSDYGGSMKITLKCATPEGIYVVWMTEPAAIETERGDMVRVTVTITPSDSDPSFGFGKRPSKAEITGRANVEEDSLDD